MGVSPPQVTPKELLKAIVAIIIMIHDACSLIMKFMISCMVGVVTPPSIEQCLNQTAADGKRKWQESAV